MNAERSTDKDYFCSAKSVERTADFVWFNAGLAGTDGLKPRLQDPQQRDSKLD